MLCEQQESPTLFLPLSQQGLSLAPKLLYLPWSHQGTLLHAVLLRRVPLSQVLLLVHLHLVPRLIFLHLLPVLLPLPGLLPQVPSRPPFLQLLLQFLVLLLGLRLLLIPVQDGVPYPVGVVILFLHPKLSSSFGAF